MTDLHSHILPGIDDGAKSARESLQLLQMQKSQGVHQIAFTPHFRSESDQIDSFVERRRKAAAALIEPYRAANLQIRCKVGAEVSYSPRLLERDLSPLCLRGTKLLLLEFPFDHYPSSAENVVYQLIRRGHVVLLAHVERYHFFQEDPNLLLPLIESGAYVQVNAGSVVRHQKMRRLVISMIRHGMVHAVASDTHSVDKRPPLISEAFDVISEKVGSEMLEMLVDYSDALFRGKRPEMLEPEPIRRWFGISG